MSFKVGNWYKIKDRDGYVGFGGPINRQILNELGEQTFVVTKIDAAGAVSEIQDPIEGKVIPTPSQGPGGKIIVWFTPGEYQYVEDLTPENIAKSEEAKAQSAAWDFPKVYQIEIPGFTKFTFVNASRLCDNLSRALTIGQNMNGITSVEAFKFNGLIVTIEDDKLLVKSDADIANICGWVRAVKATNEWATRINQIKFSEEL